MTVVETFDCNNTNLKLGDKGEKVTLLQTHLKTLGYYVSYNGHTLQVDGSFGTYTQWAVKQFQKATGHSQDGWFGPKTCKSLNEKITGVVTAEATSQVVVQVFDCPNINLSEGSTQKDLVTKLQNELKKLGYYTRQVDGDFGPYTTAAVIAFQKAKGLTQDGVFGPATCKTLGAVTTVNAVQKALETTSNSAPSDPFAVDTSKNVFSSDESNLSIDGLYFIVSGVTFTNSFRACSWKRIDLMSGGQYMYQTNPVPREYSVEVVLTKVQYDSLKNELYKMLHRKCKVASPLLDSGTYTVEISVAYQNVRSRKLTLKLVEVL